MKSFVFGVLKLAIEYNCWMVGNIVETFAYEAKIIERSNSIQRKSELYHVPIQKSTKSKRRFGFVKIIIAV